MILYNCHIFLNIVEVKKIRKLKVNTLPPLGALQRLRALPPLLEREPRTPSADARWRQEPEKPGPIAASEGLATSESRTGTRDLSPWRAGPRRPGQRAQAARPLALRRGLEPQPVKINNLYD